MPHSQLRSKHSRIVGGQEGHAPSRPCFVAAEWSFSDIALMARGVQRGKANLELTGFNIYTGATIVDQGVLVVLSNGVSATGFGPMQVNRQGALAGGGVLLRRRGAADRGAADRLTRLDADGSD